MTAKDRYKLAQAVFAKVGLNGDLYGELAKAMTLFEQVKSTRDKMASMPPPAPPSQNMQNLPVQDSEMQSTSENLPTEGGLPMA